MTEQNTGFDWDKAQQDTVCRAFGAVAVYRNKDGDIVIRQQNLEAGDGSDNVIVLPIALAEPLLMKLAAFAPKRRTSERSGDRASERQAQVQPLNRTAPTTDARNG